MKRIPTLALLAILVAATGSAKPMAPYVIDSASGNRIVKAQKTEQSKKVKRGFRSRFAASLAFAAESALLGGQADR